MPRKNITDRIVCEAYLEGKEKDIWPEELLQEWTGEPLKVCYRAMERAADRGYIEYGTSLRSGWVEPSGLELIKPLLKEE